MYELTHTCAIGCCSCCRAVCLPPLLPAALQQPQGDEDKPHQLPFNQHATLQREVSGASSEARNNVLPDAWLGSAEEGQAATREGVGCDGVLLPTALDWTMRDPMGV